MSLTPLPPLDRTSVGFRASLDNFFLVLLPAFCTEFNSALASIITYVATCTTKAADASASQAAAAISEANAAGSASAAAAGAGVALWVSGTSYTAYSSVVVSPLDHRSYRRIISGAGTTDPSVDTTNWILISWGVFPAIKVSDHKANNTAGDSLTATDLTQTRVLNTVDYNTISGASLASNEITLPAGTYDVYGRVPFWSADWAKVFLYNTADAAYVIDGGNSRATGASSAAADSFITGRFTITTSKTFKIRYYVATGGGSRGGYQINCGRDEIYTEITFTKVA
jgi:hypothetical protein